MAVGFAQRAFFTGLVNVVAFVDVGDHFVEIDIDLSPSARRHVVVPESPLRP